MLFSRESLAHVIVGDDRRFGSKHNISSGMIAVPMCVENEAQLALAKRLQRSANLISERRKLIVNNQDPVFAHGDADVATRAFQHVDVSGDRRTLPPPTKPPPPPTATPMLPPAPSNM